MKQVTYVGMDVHKNSITAVFGPARTKSESMKVSNDPKGWNRLADRLKSFDVQAVYEASSCGFEVYDELTAREWSVVVVAPSLMPKSAKERKNKTDEKDATELRSRPGGGAGGGGGAADGVDPAGGAAGGPGARAPEAGAGGERVPDQDEDPEPSPD